MLSLPTAPFHEQAVMDYVQSFCKRLGVPVKKDRYGNLMALYRRGRAQPVAISAHMDHPGCEVVAVQGKKITVQILGGLDPKQFAKSRLILVSKGQSVRAKVLRQTGAKGSKKFMAVAQRPVARGSFGYFDLPACQFKNGLIYTKAADNVMGVSVLLNLLDAFVRKKARANIACLFTRAEEVGFIGALGVMEKQFLPRKYPLVVLETSSAKAGKVKIGGGPALRVGDRWSTFSPEMDVWFRHAAPKTFQRALLPGGRCEASVYIHAGYRAGCLALPLGNYHNKGPKGFAAEYVSESDYEGLLKWLKNLATGRPVEKILDRNETLLRKRFLKSRKRLLRHLSS